MHSADEQVLERLLGWLEAGGGAWLCTIVATYGSSPRPAGSLFACSAAGETAGSLSGGCVEEELIARLIGGGSGDENGRNGDGSGDKNGGSDGGSRGNDGGGGKRPMRSRPMEIVEYGVSAEENDRLGLPCGGRLEVLLEPLVGDDGGDSGDSDTAHIRSLLEAVRERRYVRREVRAAAGARSLHEADGYSPPMFESAPPDKVWRQVFGPRCRMLLIGAGQLSQTLAELALAMDYQVLVCDPRRELLKQWAGVDVPLLDGMPDDAVRRHAADRDSIVLTLTHDPRIDDMALMEALGRDLFYIGALGSARTSAARRERLRALGISEQQLARLHAPVGLPIGSRTPMEIAIAILADLTRERAQRVT